MSYSELDDDKKEQVDKWIIKSDVFLKMLLMDRAKAGEPRPADGTLLARALQLFTELTTCES